MVHKRKSDSKILSTPNYGGSQDYGDLTELNHDGLILRSIGPELLESFTNEYLELLGTSSAIHEINGDYAYGIFSSGWCRMMDSASREFCDTEDNAQALASGRWLCHESCWNCSKRAIAKRAPVEIACKGGLRLYAIPIIAHGNVVGAINFGYGDPPTDSKTLEKLSKTYQLDYDGLVREANAYESRSPFIIEMARKRLNSTARIIGSMIETKQTEEALREDETFIRTVMDHLPIGIAVNSVKPDVEFSYMNENFAKIYQTTKEALSEPDAFWDVVYEDPVFREKIRKRVLEDTASGDPNRMNWEDIPITRKGKGPFYICARNIPLQDRKEMISTVWDISERKQAEQAIHKSEEKYRRIADNVTDVVWVADLDMNPTYISPSVERVFGIKPEEYLQLPIERTYPPASLEKFKKALTEQLEKESDLKSNKNRVIELVVERYYADGSIGWDEISAKFIRDKQSKPIAIQGVSHDITERVKVEKALRESEERFRIAQEASPDGFTILHPVRNEKNEIVDFTWIYENTAIARINGTDPQQVIGKRLLELFPEHSGSSVFHTYVRVANTGESQVLDEVYVGEILKKPTWLRFVVVSMGEQIAIFSQDITNQKQAETEKEKLQSQLMQVQKMESIGQLAGGVAHDFNNMLSVILGHTDLVLDQLDPGEPFYDNLQEIRKAAERSANLTRQLLTFARRQVIKPRIIDLNETVEGMLNMLRRLIGENIYLAWLPNKQHVQIQADPTQIDQIIANLCINARDAIKDVGVITIETHNVSFDEDYCAVHAGFVPGNYVELAISDNGCGMDSLTISHLFEPFFTTKDQGKGTGLGLASVYGAVKQNKGFINVDSELGQGTTFKVYLPRYQEKTLKHNDAATTQPTVSRGETILLVEDEASILRITTIMLEQLGYTVITAKTPDEAKNLVHEHQDSIDLLITDVVMPEMNGSDLANQVHSIDTSIKSLFMSGYTADIVTRQGVFNNEVCFIQKPFTTTQLAAKVREVLDEQ
jgi:PAS domain S-box-containing protein